MSEMSDSSGSQQPSDVFDGLLIHISGVRPARTYENLVKKQNGKIVSLKEAAIVVTNKANNKKFLSGKEYVTKQWYVSL